METTNTPVEGTGLTTAQAAENIERMLDSANATPDEVDADEEADEVSLTHDDEDADNEEHPETDSEDDEGDDSDGEKDEAVEEQTALDPTEILFEIDGQGISREEARKGYIRQSHYTRSMQELSEHRKQWQIQETGIHELRAHSQQVLENLTHHVAQVFGMNEFGPEPDWEAEWANDPYEAQMKKFKWEKEKENWQQMQQTREAAVKAIYEAREEAKRQDAVHYETKRQHEIIESREALARELPEAFGDVQKADVNLLAVSRTLSDLGFADTEIRGLTDARMIKTAYYAKLGMEAAKKLPAAVKKIEAKPALTMPGTTTPRVSKSDNAIATLRRRLKETGSLDAAASLISKHF